VKLDCEGCRRPVLLDGEAYVCSYECTFCPACASRNGKVCPHCGGELVRRPRRGPASSPQRMILSHASVRGGSGLIWLVSFAVWTFVSIAATATVYELYRPKRDLGLGLVAGMEFSHLLTYAPLTPFVFMLALRFPFQRGNWARWCLLHLGFALIFTFAHILLKCVTPNGYWDPAYREWTFAIWNSHTHAFRWPWFAFRSMFLSGVVDDAVSAYVPIVLVAHLLSYYRRFRAGELRASLLEAQLAKARLQTLKSQLQPHFLFNTMHSISALMLTDVNAADRMMTRLSDLLRMSLENAGTQITILSREIEFVNCYLEIEKIRFEDRLKVCLDIAPETLDAQIPHLLLQPLVDNAVKHGISKLSSGGEIRITASARDGKLHIEVSDNGPELREQYATPASGLGLRVTRERLESLYGGNQSLQVRNSSPGVTVSVCIPLRLQPAEQAEDQTLILETTG